MPSCDFCKVLPADGYKIARSRQITGNNSVCYNCYRVYCMMTTAGGTLDEHFIRHTEELARESGDREIAQYAQHEKKEATRLYKLHGTRQNDCRAKTPDDRIAYLSGLMEEKEKMKKRDEEYRAGKAARLDKRGRDHHKLERGYEWVVGRDDWVKRDLAAEWKKKNIGEFKRKRDAFYGNRDDFEWSAKRNDWVKCT